MRKLLLVGLAFVCAACSDSGQGEKQMVIGGMFLDDIHSDSIRIVNAVKLAFEEINESGVFDQKLIFKNRSPSKGDAIDAEKAREYAHALYDQEGALGLISESSEIAQAVIDVTNTPDYDDWVQCSSSATNPMINDPAYGGDQDDNFYRTMVTDRFYLDFGIALVEENQWKNMGLYRIESSLGEGVSMLVQIALQDPGMEGTQLVIDEVHPAGSYDIEANKAVLDSLIEASQTGGLDMLLLVTEKLHGGAIIKYLTENDFRSPIWMTAGGVSQDLFTSAENIGTWTTADRYIFGVEGDNYAGKNSDAFVAAFEARWNESPTYNGSTAYDCAYAMALSLLYAQTDSLKASHIKQWMPRFKQDNRTLDEVEVGIGSLGFSQAADVISQGQFVEYQGASGRLLFSSKGDRPSQGIRTFGPNEAGNDWEVKKRFDEDFNQIWP